MVLGDLEDKLTTSAPPTSDPSPKSNTENQSPAPFSTASHPSSIESSISMGGNEGGGRGLDRWSLFGARPVVQKSPTDPGSDTGTAGGFSLQSYFGVQKSSTLDTIKTQVSLKVEDPANFKSPKAEVAAVDGKKAAGHKLKHRDMNILTPSGF